MSFTLRFALALVAGIVAAALISPYVAWLVAALGFHFPFPRIFDRVVMATVLAAMLFQARELKFMPLLRKAFKRPRANFKRTVRGFVVAVVTIGLMLVVALALGAHNHEPAREVWAKLGKYFLSAIAVAIIEEAFFRAILFGGMTDDFGQTAALYLSAAFYSGTHLVRAPAHYYITGIHPLIGFHNLAASADQLAHPIAAFPTFFGLFLLGIILAEAYVMTGTVYFSMGLHGGFVVGAKMWPRLTDAGTRLPGWLTGWGRIPLISGATAWVLAIVILILLRPLATWGFSTPQPEPE